MPKYNLIGNCFWGSGFDEEIEAKTEQEARNLLRNKLIDLEEKAMALAIDLQEIDVQQVIVVEKSNG